MPSKIVSSVDNKEQGAQQQEGVTHPAPRLTRRRLARLSAVGGGRRSPDQQKDQKYGGVEHRETGNRDGNAKCKGVNQPNRQVDGLDKCHHVPPKAVLRKVSGNIEHTDTIGDESSGQLAIEVFLVRAWLGKTKYRKKLVDHQ